MPHRTNNLYTAVLMPVLGSAFLLLSACAPGDNTLGDNSPPVAENDRFQLTNGGSLDIPAAALLENDLDPDGDELRIIDVTAPAHGTLAPLPNGGYRYRSNGSNPGSDQFQYRVDDGRGGQATATVSLEILPGPTATADEITTAEDTPAVIDVLSNDLTMDGKPIDPTRSEIVVAIHTPPDNGEASVTPDGKIRYTPATDFHGTAHFTYTVSLGGTPSSPGTVSVTVTPVNDPPQARDDSVTTPEDTPLVIDLLANDTDADDGIDRIVLVSQPAHGTARLEADKVTYTPSPNFSGTDSFRYRVQDHAGASSNVATVTIGVSSTEDGPPVALDDTATTAKNQAITIDVLANDSDPDGNETITVVTLVTPPAQGSATVGEDKTIRFSPAPGHTGTVTFSYRLEDDFGLHSNEAQVTVTVTNTPPVAVGSCGTIHQESTLEGTLQATDPDAGESFTFRLGANGAAGNGPMTTANGGVVKLIDATTGAYRYTPRQGIGGRGRDTFQYQVTDSSGATANGTETVIVDLHIMPLGDSITAGIEDYQTATDTSTPAPPRRVSYRKSLHERLVAEGYGFDFVGSRNDGYDVIPAFDSDNEGWPGARSDQLAGTFPSDTIPTVEEALDINPADIVLLHIGTNDMSQTGVDDIENILNAIDNWEQQNNLPVTVILAKIVDQWHWKNDGHPNGPNPQVTALNRAITTMVQSRTDDVILVDIQNALQYPDDLGDRSRTSWHYWLHPSSSGYEKMAEAWYFALTSNGLLDKCP